MCTVDKSPCQGTLESVSEALLLLLVHARPGLIYHGPETRDDYLRRQLTL